MTESYLIINYVTQYFPYLKIFEYFTSHPYEMVWKDNESPESFITTQFHRTLTDYMTTLRENGFIVSLIEEPRPVEDKSVLPHNMGKLFRVPHTICVEALKLFTYSHPTRVQ